MIAVSRYKRHKCETRILTFSNFDSLADCVKMTIGQNIFIKESAVYSIADNFCLIIKTCRPADRLIFNEFADRQSSDEIEIAFAKEHGRPLIEHSAVKTIGEAFLKTF